MTPAGRASERAEIPSALKPLIVALTRAPGVRVERGWGSSTVTLKVRGKIFAMIRGDELVLKLPKARVDALVEATSGSRFDPRRDGRAMKEWVVLPRRGGGRIALAREALRFVSGHARIAE